MKDIDCYRLFLLDNHGYEKRGSYYLDTLEEPVVTENVINLIQNIVTKYSIKRIITVGSSKGGSCALYFGLKINAEACVIGAPQYKIGTYLNFEEHRNLLKAIVGEITDDKIKSLDNLIYKEMKNSTGKMVVYLHFSKYENTYKSQIVDLVQDLRKLGYTLYTDDNYKYTEHSEVSKYYPQYMTGKCHELLGV